MKKDKQTVTPDGKSTRKLIHGVTFKDVSEQVDDRGILCEMYDSRWTWHNDPLVFSYFFTIRPGVVKGWGVHKKHEDRYFVIKGEMEVVLYDDRKGSPTRGLISKIYLTERKRRLMNIPIGVWHADRNLGSEDVIIANFPTICYNHADPDKFRLPLSNKKIPHKFAKEIGW